MDTRLAKAEVLLDHHEVNAARRLLEGILAAAPDHVEALELHARALELDGDRPAAEVTLRRALALAPDDPRVRGELGRLLGLAGKTDECIETWREVLARAPESLEAMAALGIALSNAGRHAEALDLLERVQAATPQSAGALADLGRAELSAGSTERAVAHLEQAVEIAPGSAQAALNLGAALQHVGDLDRAIEHYRRAATLAPDWPIPHYDLGVAFFRRGDWFGARLHILRALDLAPEDREIRAALEGIVPAGIPEQILPRPTSTEDIAFSGQVARFGVPGLLEFLKNSGSTGTLVIARPESGVVLLLVDGDLVGGAAPGAPRLGDLLAKMGAIDVRSLERARSTIETGVMLGPALLSRRLVTVEALRAAGAEQLGEVLATALDWNDGHFHFAAGPPRGLAVDTARGLSVDTRVAILDAARILDERRRRGSERDHPSRAE